MSEHTKIEWTDHSWSPWWGCTKVSPGCAHCYAARWAKWTRGIIYAKGQPRVRTKDWKTPARWNRTKICTNCEKETPLESMICLGRGCAHFEFRRPRVFPSMMDWLDDEVPIEWLADFLALIHDTPNLDWLLLTKRPENWRDRINAAWRHLDARDNPRIEIGSWLSWWLDTGGNEDPPANIWIGASVEDQTRADERIPHLLKIPAQVRYLSCEPLLGPVNLRLGDSGSAGVPPGGPRVSRGPSGVVVRAFPEGVSRCGVLSTFDGSGGTPEPAGGTPALPVHGTDGVSWVIVGGESGPHARPMHPDWARSLRDPCVEAGRVKGEAPHAAGVAFHFKQWGEWKSAKDTAEAIEMILAGREKKLPMCQLPGHALTFYHIGKKSAGRLLDGREWDEF